MIKIKKIKPMFDHIITTMDRYEDSQVVNGIIIPTKTKSSIKEIQKVIEVGSFVKNVKPGDLVAIDPTAYGKPVHYQDGDGIAGLSKDRVEMRYSFPTVEINDDEYLYLAERDISYVIEDYEEIAEEEESSLVQMKPIIS